MADVQSKWGTVQKNFNSFGEHPIPKIMLCQFVVLLILLILIKPQIITSTQSNSHVPRINYAKVIIISVIIVAATYYIPPLTRK